MIPVQTVRTFAATLLLLGLLAGPFGGRLPFRMPEAHAAANLETDTILLDTPRDGDHVTLLTWNSPDPVTPTVQTKTIIEGVCLHCNIPMKFEAGQSGGKCNVCPCGATFADCLTGKSSKNVTWSEMLSALPHGVGLRIDLTDAGTALAGVRRLYVDLKTALLPLEKPIDLTDAALLALVKPLGVRSLERSTGDHILRLHLKDDWTVERSTKVIRALTDHGITVQFTPPSKS